MERNWQAYNINHGCKIKASDRTKKAYFKYWQRNDFTGFFNDARVGEMWGKELEKNNGFLIMQLHQAFAMFGPEMDGTFIGPFDSDEFYIDTNKLEKDEN